MSESNNNKSDYGKEFAQRKAKATNEANFYSLSNEYLSNTQKAHIEVWFQSPIKAFWIGYILSTILFPQIRPVFPAIYSSLIVGYISTKWKAKDLAILLHVFTIAGSSFWLYLFLVFELFQNDIAWISAIALLLVDSTGLGVSGHLIQGNWAEDFVYGNPKYGAAKALYGIKKFPFEEFVDDSLKEQGKRGGKRLSYLYSFILVIATIIWIKP
tara:strand:- start:232 stop:870 length:639 start_codon:yes stop_codon:yes gene_type:complete